MKLKKILILGISGMLGNTLYYLFSRDNINYKTYGTIRYPLKNKLLKNLNDKIYLGYNIENINKFDELISKIKPDYVINCIGLIKQKKSSINKYIKINSIFPKKLEQICIKRNVKLIHFSTDCIFNGTKGNYSEKDISDADDIYGISKYLGELTNKNSLTIRTSIIGHELKTKFGLIEWFLNSNKQIDGFKKAFFSGLTTVEVFNILAKIIQSNIRFSGIYHVSSNKISKFDLLNLISIIYSKKILIKPNSKITIDRSLNSSLFKLKLNYKPPTWKSMIKTLHQYYTKSKKDYN